MSQPELNSRMPFMPFNWANHVARTSRLTLEERGFFDLVRGELWSVVGCKMPEDLLVTRLRLAPGGPAGALMDSLVALGLLIRQADHAVVYDPVQVREFEGAVKKADTNKANGGKGGRPRKDDAPATAPAAPPNADDF